MCRTGSWFSVYSVLSAAPLFLCLSQRWDDMRVKHTWKAVPANWEILGHPPAGTTIDLYVALKPHHENALTDVLYEVSDPKHPKYGAYLSREQVAELVAPHQDTFELVNAWLEHHGVPSSSVSMTHGGSWLTLTGIPVSRANDLLGASYQIYQHAETKDRILRTVGYSLPTVLHAHVKTVAPTTYFGSPRRLQQTPSEHSGGATVLAKSALGEIGGGVLSSRDRDPFIKPSTLRSLYHTEAYVPKATDRNVIGIAGYFGDWPSQDDLTAFMKEYRTDGADAKFTLTKTSNGDYQAESNKEADVVIQYTEGITYPTHNIFYSVSTEEDYLAWVNYMLGLPSVPQTITTSYAGSEQDFAESFAIEVCDLFARLGARGATIIFASGNDGVGRGACKVNDGSGKVQFLPMFPGSCPYVTGVGGTISDDPETAAAFSSGGFSNYFKRPPYQDEAVAKFLGTLGSKYSGLYNASSRGFPDLAAQAYNFKFINNGQPYALWGTSCSAPTVAGVISLLNDYRISIGKRPLGWINPWLYSSGYAGFNDITGGTNPGCGTNGFSAIVGWDPITGFGTPDFTKLIPLVDLLP